MTTFFPPPAMATSSYAKREISEWTAAESKGDDSSRPWWWKNNGYTFPELSLLSLALYLLPLSFLLSPQRRRRRRLMSYSIAVAAAVDTNLFLSSSRNHFTGRRRRRRNICFAACQQSDPKGNRFFVRHPVARWKKSTHTIGIAFVVRVDGGGGGVEGPGERTEEEETTAKIDRQSALYKTLCYTNNTRVHR